MSIQLSALSRQLGALCVATVLATTAHAGQASFTFDPSVSGLPTWVRPEVNRTDGSIPPVALFGPGGHQWAAGKDPMPYITTTLQVDTAGTYQFYSYHDNYEGDLYTLLYSDSFSAADPFTNYVMGNDDAFNMDPLGDSYGSGFSVTLDANRDYVFVNTLFAGNYLAAAPYNVATALISGPGNITLGTASAVPEASSLAMMAMGLLVTGASAAQRRRRREATAGVQAA